MKRSAVVTLVLLGASTAAAYGQSSYDYYCDPYGWYGDDCSYYYWGTRGRHFRHLRRGGFGKSGHWYGGGG